MVITRVSSHARINRQKTTEMIERVFGSNTLVHRIITRSIDEEGQANADPTKTDTTFSGDVQSGPDLDRKYISTGIVNIGEAIVYMAYNALNTLPVAGDFIIDGNDEWEVIQRIHTPTLGGAVTHYEFRCKRRINSTNN